MDRLSITVLELFGMVMTAFVMIVIREDRPGRGGEPVLMRGDSSSAVRWVKICKGGKGGVRSGGMNENFGGVGADRVVVLLGEAREGGKERVSRGDNEVEERRNPVEADQGMPCRPVADPGARTGKRGDVFRDLHAATGLGGLRSRLERLMRKVGECGWVGR